MSLLLYEPLPLRTSRELGNFNEDVPLPHWYGDLTKARVTLIKIDPSKWFVADHPTQVTSVYVNDVLTEAWERKLESDGAGHTWTVVVLGTAVQDGDVVTASGYGKANATSGQVLSNPAEIIADVMTLAGRTDAWWGQLRAESSNAGIHLAGIVRQVQSIRSQIDEIAASAGGIWCYGMSRLYPTDTVSGLLTPLDKYSVFDLQTSASLADTADVLKLSFDFDYATDKPQRFIELSAKPERFNGIKIELLLPWLRGSANAESIGRRILQRLAGERYDVSFSSNVLTLRPGDWVQLIAHPLWPFAGDPTIMITEVEVTPGKNEVQVRGECVRAYPTITLTGHTVALPSTTEGGADVTYTNGIATFTFIGDDTQPLKGARVSMDGGAAKTTNDQGQVEFTAAPGDHTVAVEAVGYTPMEFQLTLG